nr:hypothetical protein Itr_chr02CG05220 [Ipomoea trifida]
MWMSFTIEIRRRPNWRVLFCSLKSPNLSCEVFDEMPRRVEGVMLELKEILVLLLLVVEEATTVLLQKAMVEGARLWFAHGRYRQKQGRSLLVVSGAVARVVGVSPLLAKKPSSSSCIAAKASAVGREGSEEDEEGGQKKGNSIWGKN